MDEERTTFLERLQSADNETKRRWMVGAVIVFMIIVVYLWLAYFNNIVASSNTVPSVAGETRTSFSFLDTMRRGTAVVSDSLKGLFGKSKEIVITPNN